MTTIASLGLQIDSGDAVEAKDNLDQLTDAGKRSEESAGKTGRAWETALGSLQGDTRQIVQELQALNAKQAELAQQMATVGRAVTSASTAFSSAAANMGAFRAEAAQAGKVQEALTSATDAGAQAGRRAAESADEQQARILAVAKASLEASQYVQSLNRATEHSAEVTAQANAVLSDSASRQASINSRAQALIATEERQAEAAKKAAGAHREEGQALEELLGKIDPTVAAMSRLDQMEQKLKGFRSSGALDAETFGEYQAKIDQARTALGGADVALNKTGMSAKATAAALRGVPAQFTDIVVSLQGGQAPLTVLLQQGGQLKDMFGGVGPAVQALGGYVMGLVNPFAVAAAAVGVLGYAYYKGSEEAVGYQKALITTGNAAGTTSDRLSAMAREVSSTVGATGAAAEVLTQLAGSGKVASESFVEITEAALEWRSATGQAVEEIVAEFVRIGKDPVAAAKELNAQYSFLTASTYSQIVALKEQGDTIGAAKLLTDTYADTIKERSGQITENLGLIEKAWKGIKAAAAGALDATYGVGREVTLAQQIEQLEQKLADPQSYSAIPVIGEDNPNLMERGRTREEDEERLRTLKLYRKEQEGIARAKADEARSQQAAIVATDKVDALEKSAWTNAEKRAEKLKEYRKSLADIRKVNPDDERLNPNRIARVEADIAKQFKDPAGRTTSVDLSGFNDHKNALSAILAEYKNHQKELDAAQKAGLISQESYASQRAAIIEQQKAEVTNAYEAEIKALEEARGRSSTSAQQRIQLDQKIADARASMVKAQKDADTELAVLATNEQGRLAKQTAATQAYVDQLERQRAALSASGTRAANNLGLGDRQQGLQRDLDGVTDRFNDERAKLLDRRRTAPDKYSQNDYERDLAILSKAENGYRDTVVDNYNKISEAQGDWRKGASSAFQNYLEQARDVAGQTRSLFTNAFSSMEDSVVNFAMTGKFSFADFTKSILADMVRIETQRAASGLLGSLASWGATAASAWFGSGPTSAGSTQAGYTPEIMDNFVSGQRAAGGPVAANSLYQVNELGPELLNQGGKTYLMMGGEGGSITPLGPTSTSTMASSGGGLGSGGATSVSVSITINSDGSTQVDSKTPMMDQFGKEIGAFVEAKYRKLLSMDLRPDGAIGRTMQRR